MNGSTDAGEGSSNVNWDPQRDLDWEVVKLLMDARSHTEVTMEQYLLCLTHDDIEPDVVELKRCLDEAVRNHKHAIEDLEAAQERLVELDD
jgi:hypothetical protein